MWPHVRALWQRAWPTGRPGEGAGRRGSGSGKRQGMRRMRLPRGVVLASVAAVGGGALWVGEASAKRREPPRRLLNDRRISMEQALMNMEERAARLFDMLDLDGSGYLDIVELQQVGQAINCAVNTKLLPVARSTGIPVEFLATVLEQGDSDGDGFISRDEFLSFMVESERRLKEQYDKMDIDGSGLLSKKEVELAMRNLELPCGGGTIKRVLPSAVKQLVEEMGVSDTHDVDYEEFRDGVVTLARKDLAPINSYWSKCYVAGPYGDSSLDCGAQVTSNAQGHMLAGFVAGVTAKTITAPLEVVLRLIITQRAPPGISPIGLMGMLLRDEGPKGLLKGNIANVLKTPPTRFLELTFLQVFSDWLSRPDDIAGGDLVRSPLAGALAGGCAMMLVYPLDTLSVRLSVTRNVYKSIGDAMRRTISLESPAALFAGIVPTVLWAYPYMAIQFGILSNLEKGYRDRQREALRRGRAPPYVNEQMRLVFNGTMASTVAGVVCLPLETARRKMQVQTIGGRQRVFTSCFEAMAHAAAREGVSQLYRGWQVVVVKTVLYSALSFCMYESVKAVVRPILDGPPDELDPSDPACGCLAE